MSTMLGNRKLVIDTGCGMLNELDALANDKFSIFKDENIQKIFGVKSYPTTVVIHKGKILATLVGYNEENTKLLKKLLEK